MPEPAAAPPQGPAPVRQDGEPWTYAAPGDPLLRRLLIRMIERLTGQPRLRALYDAYRREGGTDFFAEAVARLRLVIETDHRRHDALPREGPLLVISNHPYGVLDGIVLARLVGQRRPDFKVLTNSVLLRAPEVAPHLLAIDFAPGAEARATNLRSRAEALAHLKAGGALIVFPGGGVATTPTPFARRAVDPEWKLFTARLVREARAPVLPVFFEGQNSRLFQLASHVSQTLRLSLLFKEVHDRMGTRVRVHIGAPIPFAELAPMRDRRRLTAFLRSRTMALGAPRDHDQNAGPA